MGANLSGLRSRDVLKRERIANDIVSKYILKSFCKGPLNILEAGCGNQWGLHIEEVDYELTGVDISLEAMEGRKDLDKKIVADLRTVSFENNEYDIIYSADVLEHIDAADSVLDKFSKWLKPAGVLILRIPDRNSALGFLTRMAPFWFHIFYYRIQGSMNAGKSGYGPFKTYYNKVVSRRGIYSYCQKHALVVQAEYGTLFSYAKWTKIPLLYLLVSVLLKAVHVISFGRLSAAHAGLIYIITKP